LRRLVAVVLLAGALGVLALVLVGETRQTADIYVWFPGTEARRLSPAEGAYYQACVSPDGSAAIFAGAAVGPPRVWRTEFASHETRPLTPPDSAAFLATYSWDASQITFSSDRDHGLPSIEVQDTFDPRLYRPATLGEDHRDFSLYVMDADGGNVRRITEGPYRDLRGSFSPDGKWIVFYSNRSPYGPLWIVDSKGAEEPRRIRLEGKSWQAFRPWFSADGREVWFFAWEMRGDSRKRVLKVSVEGGVPEPLAWDDRGTTQGPFVDPSGEFLLLHNDRTGLPALWEIPLQGGEPRMLQPPLPHSPAARKIMHPTRSRNGVMTFDVSYESGSAPVRWLRRLRAGLAWRLRGLAD
jgi:dipeptidyl aminopeptidase/acylaminoacyl peptidase